MDRKHEEQMVRSTIEREKVLAERANTTAIHEHDRALNKIARQKEVDQQMSFLKLSTTLNII
ncbi:MAG: hypothetical protein EHM20_11410 [Alphaproteobacteria bacterium]|nr:MAG: hypothetical protein EHM20_11410 [Alphaproteobacteria bacterium]